MLSVQTPNNESQKAITRILTKIHATKKNSEAKQDENSSK